MFCLGIIVQAQCYSYLKIHFLKYFGKRSFDLQQILKDRNSNLFIFEFPVPGT